jgi:hypothetical protein
VGVFSWPPNAKEEREVSLCIEGGARESPLTLLLPPGNSDGMPLSAELMVQLVSDSRRGDDVGEDVTHHF